MLVVLLCGAPRSNLDVFGRSLPRFPIWSDRDGAPMQGSSQRKGETASSPPVLGGGNGEVLLESEVVAVVRGLLIQRPIPCLGRKRRANLRTCSSPDCAFSIAYCYCSCDVDVSTSWTSFGHGAARSCSRSPVCNAWGLPRFPRGVDGD